MGPEYEKYAQPLGMNLYSCDICGKSIAADEPVVICSDCGAVICLDCIRSGQGRDHQCEEEENYE